MDVGGCSFMMFIFISGGLTLKIRTAHHKDIPALAYLMEELGYPTSVEDMKQRYDRIASNPNYHTLVAEIEGEVVGMVGPKRMVWLPLL